jgi:hypothetical protein
MASATNGDEGVAKGKAVFLQQAHFDLQFVITGLVPAIPRPTLNIRPHAAPLAPATFPRRAPAERRVWPEQVRP